MASYLKLTLLIDQNYQAQVTTNGITVDGGKQRIDTLEGFAGFSPGAKTVEFNGTWAVPISGFEFDAWSATLENVDHEITIPVGAQSIVSIGQFTTAGVSQSTNQGTEFTATFVGTAAPLQ
jgi:hypothetical protein